MAKTIRFVIVTVVYDIYDDTMQLHQPSRAHRSLTQQLLQVPYMSTNFGRRAFSYSSPATQNSIPTFIKIARPYIVSSDT